MVKNPWDTFTGPAKGFFLLIKNLGSARRRSQFKKYDFRARDLSILEECQ
jgi:hypothetical protein